MNNFLEKISALLVPEPGTPSESPISPLSPQEIEILECSRFIILPSIDRMSVGFLLKHHREAYGLSQEQLARSSGVGQKHISNIEQGLTQPRWSTVRKLFPYLDLKFENGVRFIFRRDLENRDVES